MFDHVRAPGFRVVSSSEIVRMGMKVEQYVVEQSDGKRRFIWVRSPMSAFILDGQPNLLFHCELQDTSKYLTLTYEDALHAALIRVREAFDKHHLLSRVGSKVAEII